MSRVKKLIHGKGIHDLQERSHFFNVWQKMLSRCYSGDNYLQKGEWYAFTEVCEDWLTFSNFKAWMETQDFKGKVLDKDLLGDGTLYSPDTVCFIPQQINVFIKKPKQNKLLPGVFMKSDQFRKQPYFSEVMFMGTKYRLGSFSTQQEAHLAYLSKKVELLKSWLDEQSYTSEVKERIIKNFERRCYK